jgi:hypothetical protein
MISRAEDGLGAPREVAPAVGLQDGDELLSRLLALNASRHAEETRLGIAPGMKGKAAEEDEDEETGE